MDDLERLRAVFDVNVWVSAARFPGSVPDRAIEMARRGMVVSIISEEIIGQILRTLRGPRFALPEQTVQIIEVTIRRSSMVVTPRSRLSVITAKESDNRVLECAVAGRADLIVTGDRKHLLGLRQYAGIAIVSPVDFLRTVSPAG